MTTTAHPRAADDACSPLGPISDQRSPPEVTRDDFLDPWRVARGDDAQHLVSLVLDVLAGREATTAARTRARRPDDRRRWEEMVEAVVCALALAVISPPSTGRLVLPLGHKTNLPVRYRRPTQGEALTRLLEGLEGLGLAEITKGVRTGQATTIGPSHTLAHLVRSRGLKREDFGRRQDRELIVLRQSIRRGPRRVKRLTDYAETPETERLRTDVTRLNSHLASADIRYLGNRGDVDPQDRQLRRHFTTLEDQGPRFDQGGRFFGGFWQRLLKTERRHIRIEGEPVVEVDYSAAFTHIAFAQLGIAPPTGDLYRIPGLEGLRRDQIKSALNAFYFDKGLGRTRWPVDFADCLWSDPKTGEVFEGFPPEFTPARVRRAIITHHPALGSVLGTGIGFRLMFSESEIMLRVLNRTQALGIVALPLHDALVVPLSAAPTVVTLMVGGAVEVISAPIPTKVSSH